ncbi:MAG: hypothetical protein EOP06_10745 [Proteobacteria bacterium]|nr:MAG: hypothetical protein EOP06_10745 [Pseudomonadota bacterium]
MAVLGDAVMTIMGLDGAMNCAIIDIESGECLARAGVAVAGALETAGLVNARMLRAKMSYVQDYHGQSIEDILITLDNHYHLIRLIHCGETTPSMFLYLVMDRRVANLAISRRKLSEVERVMSGAPEANEQLGAARAQALRVPVGVGDDKVYGGSEAFSCLDDEMPAFMRDDVAMKLLGIDADSDFSFETIMSDYANSSRYE